MTKYHVGCGIAGIYAGLLNKDQNSWKNKTDATDEAVSAVAQYLLFNKKEFQFKHNGHDYTLKVARRNDPNRTKAAVNNVIAQYRKGEITADKALYLISYHTNFERN